MDSGCNNYMTGDRKLFQKIDTSIRSIVWMEINDEVEVQEKGTVAIDTKDDKKICLFLVYWFKTKSY